MTIVIPDEIFQATRLTEDELKQELAVILFQRDKLTLAKPAAFQECTGSSSSTFWQAGRSRFITAWRSLKKT
jgi:hypothetical protein